MNIKPLIEKVSEYLPAEELVRIEEAYSFSLEAHSGQLRQSGKPFFEHPLSAAIMLADLHLDSNSIIAGLLHDVPEDCGISLQEIEQKFGEDVKNLVDGTTRLSKVARQGTESAEDSHVQAESLRKMLVAMAHDVRVVFIKLADRLHNMRTLGYLPPKRRTLIAQETMDIYAPLAHRLGIWQFKTELEDLAFRWLQPDEYKVISNLLDVKKKEWQRYITYATRVLKTEFQKAGLTAEISGRPKNISSIYQKMHTYNEQGKEFSDINDLLALRVLVDEIADCYNALGIIHSFWHPIPSLFDDYIANPRGNMYQSLHTTLIALEGKPLEIQIRTHEMHRTAEYGLAAHWRYKEGAKKDMRFEEKMSWLRQLIDWRKDVSEGVFIEALKTDVFQDQVYVFTPKGEIKEFPQGSTPLDFAYRIHTDLGHRCTGSKVNGKLVSLTYPLKNGDVVEVMSAKSARGPSLDWLNPELGYVKSHQAKERIRQWFRKRARLENLDRGKEIVDKALKRLGVSNSVEDIASLFNFEDPNEFLISVGCGDISMQNIGGKLAPVKEPVFTPSLVPQQTEGIPSVQVLGVGDLLTHLAPCCTPVPGDKIVGYVTRTKGVTIHRQNCHNISTEVEKERLIQVTWGTIKQAYPVSISIEAEDRVGLIKDVTTIVSETKINIASISSTDHGDGTVSMFLVVHITDIGHLSRLFARLERVKGILNASRVANQIKEEVK